jgi:hypothetical protein
MIIGLRTVSVSRFDIPAYKPTLPMRISINTHKVLLTSDLKVPKNYAR